MLTTYLWSTHLLMTNHKEVCECRSSAHVTAKICGGLCSCSPL